MKHITRAVWIVSLISLFTDMASEMLYPVMPVFLQSIGFSVLLIGMLEGLAEATAGLSKGYFGRLSDATGKRAPFIQLGYAMSAVSKPLMGLIVAPVWIFFARTLDRLGKGLRTGARDALLSAEATPETKARVFGFHRSMDTLGAVIGPSLALLYLWFYPAQYRTLLFIAFIPGMAAVATTLLLKDRSVKKKKFASRVTFFSFLEYWRTGPAEYRRVMIGFLTFALFNSSDMFLLLKARQSGLSDTAVIGIYIFYNLVYALFSFPLGIVADKIGIRQVYIAGLILFAGMYGGISFVTSPVAFLALFFIYGIYAAATDGISKAWISQVAKPEDTATAIGMFNGFQSICLLLASTITGIVWFCAGATAAFVATAAVTVFVIFYFFFFITAQDKKTSEEKAGTPLDGIH